MLHSGFVTYGSYRGATMPYTIGNELSRMRPPQCARQFVDQLLRCEHHRVSTRWLPKDGETIRQRSLRWALAGVWERLSADLRTANDLIETRLKMFDAIAERARATRIRVCGARAARLRRRMISGRPWGQVGG